MTRLALIACLVLAPAWAAAKPLRPNPERELLEKHWGLAVDPERDSTFRADRDGLRITVPGKPRVMSVEIGKTNAPRVLREIVGDFSVEVKVSGAFPADARCLIEGRWPYHGAGLLVWQDEKNYVRLERAHMHLPSGLWRCYPGWELRQDGKMVRGWQPSDGLLDEAKAAYFRIARSAGVLTGSYSQDGKDWRELPQLQIDFGKQVRVGVEALQNTPTGFEALFEGFKFRAAPEK
jgi:regulation of enolase protein 1 (concanavalin A-like superfamily)